MNSNKYLSIATMVFGSLFILAFNNRPPGTLQVTKGINFGDTSSFAPNTTSGWNVLSSYLDQESPGIVSLELLLKRTGRIEKTQEHFIGTITNAKFIPAKNQKVDYYLLSDNVWQITIDKDGKCYLLQQRGLPLKPSSLAGGPDVIPINIRYKNN